MSQGYLMTLDDIKHLCVRVSKSVGPTSHNCEFAYYLKEVTMRIANSSKNLFTKFEKIILELDENHKYLP